jgi:leucyl aminopeptidase (aminopeptidase T)
MDMNELNSACRIALLDCMGLKPGEKTAVITDEPCRVIGLALFNTAMGLGNETILIEIVPRKINGEEPPAAVAELMKQMDVVLCPTSKSLTHTNARRAAKELGVRVATLPGINEEIFVRCMNADYNRIAALTNRLCALLDETSVIRVTSPSGTDITMPKQGRKAIASHGLFHAKGEGGNLPTGEAYLAPVEGQSTGVVVVDGSFAGIGKLSEPVTIRVKNGFAAEISGGAQAREIEKMLDVYAPLSRNVAEFGIGTNERAIVSGAILEDEKILGTIHIAFGDNVSMGGSVNVRSHLDGIVRRPSVWFDDRMIMQEGNLLI